MITSVRLLVAYHRIAAELRLVAIAVATTAFALVARADLAIAMAT